MDPSWRDPKPFFDVNGAVETLIFDRDHVDVEHATRKRVAGPEFDPLAIILVLILFAHVLPLSSRSRDLCDTVLLGVIQHILSSRT